MATLTKSEVINLVTAVLNASPGVYGTSTDPLFTTGEIDDAIDAADQAVFATIIGTPGHPNRAQYIVWETKTNGSLITKPLDGGVEIDGTAGIFVSPAVLSTKARNPVTLSTTTKNGYYTVVGHAFHFVGTTAKVSVVDSSTATGSLISPSEYVHAVIAGALAILFPKEGANIEAANHFGSQYTGMLGLIKQAVVSLPAVSPFFGGQVT